MKKRSYLRLLFMVIALAALATGSFAEQIDVSQEAVTNWWEFNASAWLAQSFTPNLGWLTAVEGLVYPYSSGQANFTVEIWAYSPNQGPDPRIGTAPLATKTVSNVNAADWIRWQFDSPVNVSQFVGTESLLIIFKTDVGSQAMPMHVSNPYAGGKLYGITNTGGSPWTWQIYAARDVMFHTFGMPYTAQFCGDTGTTYNMADLNKDCHVNLKDFATLAENWMKCSDPANVNCDIYWLN